MHIEALRIEDRTDAVRAVLSGIQFLIMTHATTCAREQYVSSSDVDKSDEVIAENKDYVSRLRGMREMFENLVTGIILDIRLPEINRTDEVGTATVGELRKIAEEWCERHGYPATKSGVDSVETLLIAVYQRAQRDYAKTLSEYLTKRHA